MNLRNLDFNNVFIRNDQPTVCSKCGARTEIVLDLPFTKENIQIHKCLDLNCKFEFVEESDEDFVFI